MRYQVVTSNATSVKKAFLDECNELISQGYQPLGGIVVHSESDGRAKVYQAFYFPEERPLLSASSTTKDC